jgi:hypothetical protein
MNPKELETIKKTTGYLEGSLKAMEDILDHTNNRALYQATGSLMQALRYLHEVEPTLLGDDCRIRVEALIDKEKVKTGRDSFNTGF